MFHLISKKFIGASTIAFSLVLASNVFALPQTTTPTTTTPTTTTPTTPTQTQTPTTTTPTHTQTQNNAIQTTTPTSTNPMQQSNLINEVVMAEDTKGPEREPVAETTTFKPNSIIHAVVRIQNAPAQTNFKAAWYVVDVGNVAPPNTLIDSTDINTDGSRNIDFTLAPTTTWPPGTYRVEISVNNNVDKVKTFTVK